MVERVQLVVQRGCKRVVEADRLDAERGVGTRAIADDHLGDETLDERMAHVAIDGRHEVEPVRRQARREVRDVDDEPSPKPRASAYAAIISRYVVTSAPPIS